GDLRRRVVGPKLVFSDEMVGEIRSRGTISRGTISVESHRQMSDHRGVKWLVLVLWALSGCGSIAPADCDQSTPCPSGHSCVAGVCVACPLGRFICDGACVDPMSDPLYCGVASDCSGGVACGGASSCAG